MNSRLEGACVTAVTAESAVCDNLTLCLKHKVPAGSLCLITHVCFKLKPLGVSRSVLSDFGGRGAELSK